MNPADHLGTHPTRRRPGFVCRGVHRAAPCQHVRFYLDGKRIHDIGGTLESTPRAFAASCVKDSASGDTIVKLVNGANTERLVRVKLDGANGLPATAEATVLAGSSPALVNDYGSPDTVLPHTVPLSIAPDFNYAAPPNSLSVIRIAPWADPSGASDH